MKCYLCGLEETSPHDPLTDDHVPPKNLFHIDGSERMGSGLITVRAHRSCNQGHQLDDEYLRFITVTPSTDTHPKAKKVWDKVLRAVKRPQSKGFLKHIQENLQMRDIHTPAGIFLGKRPGFEIDGKRTSTIIFRICRGLYHHKTGKIMPADIPHSVFPFNDFKALRKQGEARGEFEIVCEGIFKFIWRTEPDNDLDGFFWLAFYDAMEFFIATGNKSTKPGLK